MWLLLVKKDSLKNQTKTIWCLQGYGCIVFCKRYPIELQGNSLEEVQPSGHWVYLWDIVYRMCHGLAVPTLYCAGGSRYILRDYHTRGCCGSLLFQLASESRWLLKCTPKSEARDSLSIWAVDSAETWFDSGFIPLGWLRPLLHWVWSLCTELGMFPLGISTSWK